MRGPSGARFGCGPGVRRLAERFGLGEPAAARLEGLCRILVEDPAASTAVREPARVLEDHLADSLVALELPEVAQATTVVDIGSGAGLPALPLAIALPEARFTLVESAGRKCAFLERVAAEWGIANVRVLHGRAEEAAARLGAAADLVTVRAVSGLDVVAEYAAPLLAMAGFLVAWRGRRDPQAELEGQRAAGVVGLEPVRVVRVRPYPDARNRYLHLMSKVSATPERFPRRPGMAVKRPLGRA